MYRQRWRLTLWQYKVKERERVFSFLSVEDESKNCVSSGSGGGAIVDRSPISRLPLLTIFYTITRRNTRSFSLVTPWLWGFWLVRAVWHISITESHDITQSWSLDKSRFLLELWTTDNLCFKLVNREQGSDWHFWDFLHWVRIKARRKKYFYDFSQNISFSLFRVTWNVQTEKTYVRQIK